MSTAPLLPFNKPVAEYFKTQGWFETEKLLSTWYMLSNEHMSVLIDTAKPKIVNIFTYGRYGTLRALLYDTGWDNAVSNWLFGITPSYQHKDVFYLPLKYGPKITEPDAVEFDPANNTLIMRGLHFFPVSSPVDPLLWSSVSSIPDAGVDSTVSGDWKISLAKDGLELSVQYHGEVENTRLLTWWHPIFTHCVRNKDMSQEAIIYAANTDIQAESRLAFIDQVGRIPRLVISSSGARIVGHPRSEKALRGAYRLPVSIGMGKDQKTFFCIEPNAVTLEVNPHIDAGIDQPVIIFADTQPVLTIDGRQSAVPLQEIEKGKWAGQIQLGDGEHMLIARTAAAESQRRIFAHGDVKQKMAAVGEAYLKLQYKNGPLAGLFPYVYIAQTLQPVWKWWGANEGTCNSYAIRITWLLSALYELYHDNRYADALFKKLSSHYDKCHKYEDGSVMPPSDLQPDGTPVPGGEQWPRPMNQFEAVFACTMAYYVFKSHGAKDRALQCLKWAAGYAKAIENMQRSDGALYERYTFGTFSPASQKVFPTPSALGLIEYIRALEKEEIHYLGMTPSRLKKIITRQIDYARSLPQADFKMLSGSEAHGNSSACFVAFSMGRLLTRYVYPKDADNDDKLALDAAKLATYLCAFYPEYPQFYMIQGGTAVAMNIACPLYARMDKAEPNAGVDLMSKGDMDDFQEASLGLALLRHRQDEIGLLLARYPLASRLSTAILPGGAVCECEVDVPGYRFQQTEYSVADTNAATLGLTLYHYVTGIPMT